MTYTPHSLLDAAKLTADAAGIDWALAHRYYRDLQGDPASDYSPWLPKSLGRNIWSAHPHYIARYLIALCMADRPSGAAASVDLVASMTPDGRTRHLSETDQSLVELALTHYLINEGGDAKDVDRIEFDPVMLTVSIILAGGSTNEFSVPGGSPMIAGAIYRRGILPGSVLSALSSSINWRRNCDAPLAKVSDGAVDIEA